MPTIINPEIPVTPFNDTPNLVARGAQEGATLALRLTVVYSLLVGVGFPLWSAIGADFAYFYLMIGSVVIFIIAALCIGSIFGAIPATIIGIIGGVIVGLVFPQIPTQLSLAAALTVGIISGALLLLPLTLIAVLLLFKDSIALEAIVLFWLLWGFPTLVAVFGFAWVGHKLNLLLPHETPNG